MKSAEVPIITGCVHLLLVVISTIGFHILEIKVIKMHISICAVIECNVVIAIYNENDKT